MVELTNDELMYMPYMFKATMYFAKAIDIERLQPEVPNVKALVVPMHLSLMEVDGWVESPKKQSWESKVPPPNAKFPPINKALLKNY